MISVCGEDIMVFTGSGYCGSHTNLLKYNFNHLSILNMLNNPKTIVSRRVIKSNCYKNDQQTYEVPKS